MSSCSDASLYLRLTQPIADFAGELARELERRAALHGPAVGVAPQPEAVELEVVLARVGADFDERLEPRHQVVAGAQRAAEAIVVAVGVAGGRAVGEFRLLIFGALGRALHGDLEAVEALRQAERAAERGVDREARRGRPARSGCRDCRCRRSAMPSPISAVSRVHVEAAGDLAVERRAGRAPASGRRPCSCRARSR